MLMEDGFSYTKSELEEEVGDQAKDGSRTSSGTGSLSDELTDSDIERNIARAKKAKRTIEQRMKYFRRHIQVLKVDRGRIIDPLRSHATVSIVISRPTVTPDRGSVGERMSSSHSIGRSSMSQMVGKHTRLSNGSRKSSGTNTSMQRSVSMDNFSVGGLDQIYKKKRIEESDGKRTMFQNIKTKRSVVLKNLQEYLTKLEKKQQERLVEEHTNTIRQFKYAGPSREGPLFCLREKYRRERKAWRVKYAKKYGLFCSKVRLEKRLMRKAQRLLMRERILNALKDKSKSKLMVLLEMKAEFKKLVDRLKLNKEIQEKIKRQDKLAKVTESHRKKSKHAKPNVHSKKTVVGFSIAPKDESLLKLPSGKLDTSSFKKDVSSKFRIGKLDASSSKNDTSNVGKMESEAQKSANVKITTSRISSVSGLSRLPSVPCTSQTSSTKLPYIKKPLAKPKKQPPPSLVSSKTATRCPPLVHDKKLGSTSVAGCSSVSAFPQAKVAKTRQELPLIHEKKLGTAWHKVEMDDLTSESTERRLSQIHKYQTELKKKEEKIESLARQSKQNDSVKTNIHQPSKSIQSQTKRRPSIREMPKGKLVRHVQAPNWPTGTIIPIKELPGGYVRQSAIDPVPRNKFTKPRNILDTKGLDIFALQYRRAINDQLTRVFGPNRSDSFLNKVLMDVKKMSDFILDHLHEIPLRDLDFILGRLMDLKEDPRFESFRSAVADIRQDLVDQNDTTPGKRYEIQTMVNELIVNAEQGYDEFQKRIVQRRKEFREKKSAKHQTKVSHFSATPTVEFSQKKRRRRTLADKLLISRTSQFTNPIRVTTKLGGRLMLQGWKSMTFEEYFNLGKRVPIYKSGWRNDGMQEYEVIAPSVHMEELKYLLVLNRLDLTPRRFKFPGYKFDGHILQKYMYSSNFYRTNLLKKERKTEKGRQKLSFQHEMMGHKTQRAMVWEDLAQGEFTVPHLRHRIFRTPEYLIHVNKPQDKHTPMIFSLRNEFEEYDEDDPKVMKIRLQETPTLDLFEYKSTAALRGTQEAAEYLKDNRRKAKYNRVYHRKFGRETQTPLVNFIDRGTQMYAPDRDSKRTNVYDTDILKANIPPPPPKVKPAKKPGFQEEESSDSSGEASVSSVESMPDETTKVLTSADFASSVKLTLRIMDSQLYANKQLTFRQGLHMNPLDPKAEIAYSHERMFSFIDHRLALSEYVVTSMDWSSVNPNLLAVGYARHPLYPEQDKGLICIWNVKLITMYEQKFDFKSGVTYLQFCAPYPRLLNVAFLDGSVVILDLGAKRNQVVTAKLNSVFSDYKPVWQFSWIELGKGQYLPITCGDNGHIHQLRPDGTFHHSKFLSLGHREGKVKGIKISSSMGLKPRIRGRPGITCMEKHPTDPVTYLVGTTDGCVHICSIHFRNQHLDVFSAHIGAVKGIQFHPHCEQVFLTFGEDFYVRVWLYGTFEPALELMAGNYYVRAARWSPANAEILVSISNKFVDVWDVRRKTDSPIHRFKNPRDVENTALVFDSTGGNIVVGTISGDVYVYALKNMPFTHHFKGEAIANSMEKVLKAKKRFVKDIRKLGYPFGTTKDPSL